MAEFASAVVGLIQVTEHVALRVYRYIKHVKKAETEIRELSTIITSLLGTIHGIELAVRELDARSKDHVLQSKDLVACKHTITELNLKLANFLDASQSDKTILKTHAKWKWPFSATETAELCDKLEAHKSALSLSLATENLCAILQLAETHDITRKDVRAIKKRMEVQTRIELNKEREQILKSLIDITPLHRHKTNSKLRQPGTGDWFVESREFQEWLATDNARLWLYGIPGAGKSILMSYAVEKVLSIDDTQSADSAVAYFYCDYKDNRTQTPQAVLSCIAQQIARQHEDCFAMLEDFVKNHSTDKQSATLSYDVDDLCELITDMAMSFDQVSILVDGLDECETFVADVTSYLADLARNAPQIKTLLSSRNLVEIRGQLEEFDHISIAARNSDLVLFVGEQIGERMKPRSRTPLRIKDPALKGEILDTLLKKADGMFRWVALQLDYICGLPTDKSIREALRALPPDLFSSYERLLLNINKKPEAVRNLVSRTMKWVLTADDCKFAHVICEAVSIEPDMQHFEIEAVPDKDEVLRLCGSFIRESIDGSKFESAHFTVNEFFSAIDVAKSPMLAPYRFDEDEARKYFAEVALTYLCADDFKATPLSSVRDVKHDARGVPGSDLSNPGSAVTYSKYGPPVHEDDGLQQVAENRWYFWYRDNQCDPTIMELTKKLFNPKNYKNLTAWGSTLFAQWSGFAGPDRDYLLELIPATVDCLSPLHFASMLNAADLSQWLIEQGCSVHSLSPVGSPLHCALVGNLSTILWTLSINDEDNTKSTIRHALPKALRRNYTPFTSRDFRQTQCTINALMAAGANVNDSRVFTNQTTAPSTILDLAFEVMDLVPSWHDQFEVWIDILADLVDGGARSEGVTSIMKLVEQRGESLKHLTSKQKFTELVKKLIEYGLAKADGEDLSWLSSTSEAQHNGYPTQTAAIITNKDDTDKVWFNAAKYSYTDVIARLLSLGVHDIDALNADGASALHLAAMSSSTEVVKQLISKGANINRISVIGSNPLLDALSMGSVENFKLLIENEADYMIHDNDHENIWHYVSRKNSDQMFPELLKLPQETRTLLEEKSKTGQTPLASAAHRGNKSAFFQLLEMGADEWAVDNDATTVLQYAALGGNHDIVQYLLKRGHNVLAQDNSGVTALLYTISHKVEEESQLRCMRAIYEADPACALLKDNEGASIEELMIRDLVSCHYSETIIVHWDIVQSIFMRDSARAVKDLLKQLDIDHRALNRTSIVKTFRSLLKDFQSDMEPLLHDVLAALLSAFRDPGKPEEEGDVDWSGSDGGTSDGNESDDEDKESLDSLLIDIIDMIPSQRLQSLFIKKSTVLNFTLRSRRPKLISHLLDKGVDVDAKDEDVFSKNAVQLACTYPCGLDSFKRTLKLSQNLAVKTKKGGSLLFLACMGGHIGKVQELLDAGMDIQEFNSSMSTPLHIAVGRNRPGVVKLLLEHHADATCRDVHESTPIYYAVKEEFLDTLSLFPTQKEALKATFEFRVNLEELNVGILNYQVTLLHLAAAWGKLGALKQLLQFSDVFSANGTPEQDLSPLSSAVLNGERDIVQHLLAAGASHETSVAGFPVLHLAAFQGFYEIVALLLNSGCNVEATDKNGLTAYAYATKFGHRSVIASLRVHSDEKEMARKVRLNESLGHAIKRGDLVECEQLVNEGASVTDSCVADEHYDPFLYALWYKEWKIARYLLRKGASCNAITPDGKQTALHLCTQSHEYDLVNIILDICPGLLFVADEIHPVHLAIIRKNNKMLRTMLRRSADCWLEASKQRGFGLQSADNANHTTKRKRLDILPGPLVTDLRPLCVASTLPDSLYNELEGYHLCPALICAIRASNVEAVQLLHSYGCPLDSQGEMHHATPLLEAFRINNREIISILLGAGTSMHRYSNECYSDLEEIAVTRNDKLSKEAAALLPSIYSVDIFGRNLVARLLLTEYGNAIFNLDIPMLAESLTAPDQRGETALNNCFNLVYSPVHAYVLNSGIDISASTPVFGSVVNHRWVNAQYKLLNRVLRRLGKTKCKDLLNVKPQYRSTPLYYAAARGFWALIKVLLKFDADLDMVGGPLGSALMAAATYGRLAEVKMLVDAGAAITYISSEDGSVVSAFVQAAHFPKIQRWLLVDRFLRTKSLESPKD